MKIDKKNLQDVLGLTAMQEGMLFHFLSNPGSNQYFEQIRLRLKGSPDVELFKQTWKHVAKTNEILRAVIRWEKMEDPVQVILKHKDIPLRVESFADAPPGQRKQLIEDVVAEDRNTPIDLASAPFRLTLCFLPGDECELILTFHHILFDGWSSGIILSEFMETYTRLAGRKDIAPVTKTPLKEFFKWYKGRDEADQMSFWKDYLSGFDTRTMLPYSRQKVESISRVQTHKVRLSPRTAEGLERLGREKNITSAALLYTAWGLLLQTYNFSEDVIFGTTVSGRPPGVPGIEKTAGMFINTLPVRLTASGKDSVSDVLERTAAHLAERNDYEHGSLTEIKKYTGIGREIDLFDSIVVIDNYPLERLLEGDYSLSISSCDLFEMTNFDLTVQVLPFEETEIHFHYNRELFEPGTIERMAGHYLNILETMVTDPSQTVSQVYMLSETEEKEILEVFNTPDIRYVVEDTIHGIISRRAEQNPGKTAVRYEDRRLTYEELNRGANRLAHHLIQRGVTVGTRVALMFPRSVEMIAGLLAVLKTGAACVPLDISYPDERNNFIIEDSGARVLLKHSHISYHHTADVTEVSYGDQESMENLEELSAENPGVEVKSTDLSYIIYTSGSTGKPKGALLHHSGIVNHTWTKIGVLGMTAEDSTANTFSINVIASVWQILAPLFTGGRLVVYSDEVEWDPHLQFQRAAEDGISVIEVIPPILKTYLDLLDDGSEPADLSKLRKIALTSEETKPFVVNKFHTRYKQTGLVDCYGQTENCDDILHYTIPADTNTTVVPIGTPALNTQVLILNHHNRLQPVGVVGEICSSGAGVGYGYWNRPELSKEKFTPNPLNPDTPMYRTGDLGRWLPDGKVEYLGRIDHQVKIRGNRVELREIENHILKYPDIKAAAVIARDDSRGEKNLYAFFVSDNPITASDMRTFLLKTLPDYMLPVQFVHMEKLPLTPNGKIDRKALALVEAGGIGSGTDYKPPRGDYEKKIHELWTQLLEKDKIGTDDNFFDLGGHSLLLIKLKSKLEKTFGGEIAITELFNYPTIRLQAGYFEEDRHKKGKPESSETVSTPRRQRAGKEGTENRDIAVIGISLRVPGAGDIAEFWENLKDGAESISFFDDDQLEEAGLNRFIRGDCSLVPAAGVLGGIDLFDAHFFGYTPREAQLIDPQQRLFLEHSWMALEDAGYVGETYPGLIGIYAGVGFNTYLLNNVLSNPSLVNALGEFQTMLSNDKDFLATRVSYKLNLKGAAMTVQTACSTSLVAVHQARQALLTGDCDIAITGGSMIRVPEKTGYFYNEGGHLSPDGHCRAFDAESQGTVFGNGVAAVVLKRLQEALIDRDHIYAVIKGSAVNNDGSLKVGFTSPSEVTQSAVIRKAIEDAGVTADTIGYVETHGTGTRLGDPIEISSLTRAFRGTGAAEKQYCAVGALKANIGHLDVTAGVAGLIKAVLCLKYKQIPPSINFVNPNPVIDFENSPFYVNAKLAEWPGGKAPRRAGVNALGIGGTNAHIILEEAPAPAEETVENQDETARPYQLFPLSAQTQAALDRMTENLAHYLEKNPSLNTADAAYTLQVGRKAFKLRKKLVVSASGNVSDAFQSALEQEVPPVAVRETDSPIIFMFPGQGAQYVDMALELYQTEKVFRLHMDRCLQLIQQQSGIDFKPLLYPGGREPEEGKINQTEVTQPLVFAVEYSMAQLLMQWGLKPYAMIGHSIGEYAAACLSGVMELEDAVTLVVWRGRLMQQMAPGAMLSVDLSEQELTPLMEKDIALAAVNGQSLCVVSGPHPAVDAFQEKLTRLGHECRKLHTSHAFHSDMMEPMLEAFTRKLEEVTLKPPAIPFVSNVTGGWITDAQAVSPAYWASQLRQGVRFFDGLNTLSELESPTFIEAGPGSVLSTFARRHPRKQENWVIADTIRHPRKPVSDSLYLMEAVGSLWQAGCPIDWPVFHGAPGPTGRRRLPLPPYPFERKSHWLEAGDGGVCGPEPAAAPGKKNMRDWFYMPAWKQTISPMALDLEPGDTEEPGGTMLVFLDECSFGSRLVDLLKERNPQREIITVRTGESFKQEGDRAYTLNPSRPGDYDALIGAAAGLESPIDSICHLWLLTPGQTVPAEMDTLSRLLDLGVYSLLYLVQALNRQSLFQSIQVWAAGNGLHQVEGRDRGEPGKAAVLGPCNVISQEYSNLVCRGLDLDILPPGADAPDPAALDTAASLVAAELEHPPAERFIAYRGTRRWVRAFEPVKLPERSTPPAVLREQGTYMIVGGTGKIGLSIAQALVETLRARLVLTTLAYRPGEKEFAAAAGGVRRLEEMGAEVLVVEADLSDTRDMRAAVLCAEERFGPLHGVIHAAGVMADSAFKTIAEQENTYCTLHFQAKMTGLYVLHDVLRDKPLDFVILTSSLSSLLGGLGMYAYSAANCFMDMFARARSGAGAPPYMSINWPEWGFQDDGAENKPTCAPLHMTPEEGREAFKRVLYLKGVDRIVISDRDLEARLRQWVFSQFESREPAEAHGKTGPAPGGGSSTPAAVSDPPQTEAERVIAFLWEELLGISAVGVTDDFFQLGGHSLIATKFISRLRDIFQVDISLQSMFERPTIQGIVETIAQTWGDAATVEEIASAYREAGLMD